MILGQISNYNNTLKEQVDRRKDVKSTQSKIISKENVLKPRLRAKANEHALNALDDNKVITERKEKKRKEGRQLDYAKMYANRLFL